MDFQKVPSIVVNQNIITAETTDFIGVHKVSLTVAFTNLIALHHSAVAQGSASGILGREYADRSNARQVRHEVCRLDIVAAQEQNCVTTTDDGFAGLYVVLFKLHNRLQDDGDVDFSRPNSRNRDIKRWDGAKVGELITNHVHR